LYDLVCYVFIVRLTLVGHHQVLRLLLGENVKVVSHLLLKLGRDLLLRVADDVRDGL